MLNKKEMIEKKERAAKEAARKQEIEARILESLPDDLRSSYVFAGGYRCEGTIKFDIETREELPALLKALPPMRAAYYRGSCTTFCAASRLTDKERQEGEDGKAQVFDDLFGVTFKMSGGANRAGQLTYNTRAFSWWTELGGLLVKCVAEVKDDPARFVAAYGQGAYRGRKFLGWKVNGLPSGNYIKYWSEDPSPNDVQVYWHIVECEDVESFAHVISTERNY